LFQAFRYGKEKLKYEFNVPDGEYLVELYFIEPWLGVGGIMNAKGMRLFDVAINGKTVLDDLDIWHEAGTNAALKKTVKAKITGGKMIISFPESKVGQAVISAIAIASLNQKINPTPFLSLVENLSVGNYKLQSWLDIGHQQFSDADFQFSSLPSNLFGADWIQFSKKATQEKISFATTDDVDVFVGIKIDQMMAGWLKEWENTGTVIITDEYGGRYYQVYRKRFMQNTRISIPADNRFLVMILPVTNMQPAFDLKPTIQYKTNVVKISEGVIRDSLNGRFCPVIKTNKQVSIEYPIQVGAADIYSITMKYFYGKEQPIKGKLQLIGAGNNMMLEEEVSFTFTREGKWNQFTINTANMINAGIYTVKLIIDGAEGLAISGIDIQ
jgi:beta-galactosidase